MIEFPITLTIPDLNPEVTTPSGIAREIVENMYGTVDTVLMDVEGQDLDFARPEVIVKNVKLLTDPSQDRSQIFQNKSGEIALLDDAYGISDTVILPEGLVGVDWDMGKRFLCLLSGDRPSTFFMLHSQAGMEITILLINSGTKQQVETWDSLIHWPAGTAPDLPLATPGTTAMQKIGLVNVNGTIFGEYDNYSGITGGAATVPPPTDPPTFPPAFTPGATS